MNSMERWISNMAAPLLDLFAPCHILLRRRGCLLLDNVSFLVSDLHERVRQVDHSLFPRGCI